MNQEERTKVVNILTYEIGKVGPIPLPSISKLIPTKIYSAVTGPKKWLENEFPEFFVFGTNGHETVDFANSPLATFYRRLISKVPPIHTPTPIKASTVRELIAQAGLSLGGDNGLLAIKQLLRVYPAYTLVSETDGVADSAPTVASAAELEYIHAIAYMNWKRVYNKIRQFSVNEAVEQNGMRNSIVYRFSKALLDGDGLLLDAVCDSPPRVVIYTGYDTDQKEPLYCVLKPNENEGVKQAWMLEDIVYPNEPDENGLGAWLAQRFFAPSDISYKTIQMQINALITLREQLLPRVSSWLQALETSVCPEAIAADIAQYETQWTELNENLQCLPSICVSQNARLPELLDLLDEKNELMDIANKAVARFLHVCDEMKTWLPQFDGILPEVDYSQVQKLFKDQDINSDAKTFLEILHPYESMKKVMCTKNRAEVCNEIDIISDHFSLSGRDIVRYFLGQYGKSDAYLDLLDEIKKDMERCSQASSEQEEPVDKGIDTDELANQILGMTTTTFAKWIELYNSLMPQNTQLRTIVLGDAEDTSDEVPTSLTPGGVAARLLSAVGNQDRLAERYLLLGLITDRKGCVPQLLELYRKNGDSARFLAVWESGYRATSYTAQDACYRLVIRCENEDISWNEIEEFLSHHPGVKQLKEYQNAILIKFSQSGQHSSAHRRWLGMNDFQLNQLELAVADNNMDAVYLLLEDPQKILDLGYDTHEIAILQQAVATGFVSGMDIVAKAKRLYQVQKNKNDSAECLLWTAPLTVPAQKLLFNIYSEIGDDLSVCWLMQKYSIPIDTTEMVLRYATALSRTQQYPILSELLMAHPEMWHRYELLEGLSDPNWAEIYQREVAHPILENNLFVTALIEDNSTDMEIMLSNVEQMVSWGYSEDMIEELRTKLSSGAAPTGTDRVSVVKRFKYYLRNLHRHMESYLYQQCDANLDWAVQHLYALSFAEQKYVDAMQYFENYPLLQRADSNVSIYLWCLLRQEKTQELIDQALRRPNSLRVDKDLANAILEHAQQNNMQELSDDIQTMIIHLPQNAFEEAVMQSKLSDMQKYVSDPDLLTALGYSAESIARFKERISKPFPYGNEGFPLGVRMRLFFGNERALPFLEDAMDDPRAVKLLLDIRFSMRQWDMVCSLYRDHLSQGIWNSTYEQRYFEALAKSRTAENCQVYLEYLQNEEGLDKSGSVYQWKYLRCLVGTRQEEVALEQIQVLLRGEFDFEYDIALDAFDLAWENGSENLRQQTALLAAHIYLKHKDNMSLEMQKAVLSLNGRLLLEADAQRWIDFFKDNGLEQIATFLMCYFNYGIGSDADSLQSAAEALFALLNEPNEQYQISILTAVTKFALSNNLVDDGKCEKNAHLLVHWLESILLRDPDSGLLALEGLPVADFLEFLEFWNTVTLTDEQMVAVLTECFSDIDVRTEWTAVFFQRVVPVLSKAVSNAEYETKYSSLLMKAFTQWFSTVEETDTGALKIASVFLQDAVYSSSQLKCFLELFKDHGVLYDRLIRDVILARCDNNWTDALYSYWKGMYFCPDQEDRQQEALTQAQLLLYAEQIDFGTDNQSLQFAYCVVCGNPTPHNLLFLYELYQKAEKFDYADIVMRLNRINNDNGDTTSLREWFFDILENRPVEWIEYHSKWWAPLVLLQETDNQTKSILSYLTNDDASMQYKGSVLRLLLSDLCNSAYIGCYLRLEPEMPVVASVKLIYIRALHTPSICEEAIRECIAKKQYLYAVKLLTEQVRAVPAHAVFIGQTLADIYTAESVKICPELTEYIPSVFRHIISLNFADKIGAWKNIGRAVDIAILTQRENLFLDLFAQEYQNVYVTYSGKCAALIANLMLRKQFETAAYYLDEYKRCGRDDQHLYMALLTSILDDCRNTGSLSEENEILLRSIPTNGNMRSLELYGSLVAFAMKKQWLKHCARAFYKLRNFAKQDKALLCSCIHLYSVIADEHGVEDLYAVSQDYLSNAKDTFIERIAQVLTVISVCVPEPVPYAQLITNFQDRIVEHNSDVMRKIYDLRNMCWRFLEDAHEDTERRIFLLRAATGWWTINEASLQYFAKYPELCTRLKDIYTTSFYCACVAAVLRQRTDDAFREKVLRLFDIYNYAWGMEQVSAIANYPQEQCERLLQMMDAPMDLPGLYTECLAQTMVEEDEDLFIKQMSLLLVVQQTFLSEKYEANVYSLKDMCESCPNSRRYTISRLILKKTLYTSEKLRRPQAYIEIGAYEKAIIAAEKQLEQKLTLFYETLNKAYIDLGKFMTEHSTSQKFGLVKLMNMTTLLCQSASYGDMEKLLAVCPAKWKLCLRSVQEMIQGNPRNVLYLLSNKVFKTHSWCHAYVYKCVENYLTNPAWVQMLKREDQDMKRNYSISNNDLNSVPAPTEKVTRVLILRSLMRKPVKLDSFKEFVDEQIRIMNEEDMKLGDNPPQDKESDSWGEVTVPGTHDDDIWKIPFIAECLGRYQPNDPDVDESNMGSESEEDQVAAIAKQEKKEALIKALSDHISDDETVKICSELLYRIQQESITHKTKEYCVKLGLSMYREKCEKRGMALYATEESRNILYSMAPLAKEMAAISGVSEMVNVYLRQCLESYQNLSQLTGDCAKNELLILCNIIHQEDRDAAACLKKHILFAREIGKRMREPMTNTERQDWLYQCITNCRSVENPVEKGAKETLINILTQEIRAFRNKAQLDLTVHNSESPMGYGCIFGKVDNIGGEGVVKLVLSLYINDMLAEQYSLPALPSTESVPFALPCGDDETQELSYKLTLKYVTRDGMEEWTKPVEGIMTFVEKKRNSFQRYDASNPAESDNYVERISISTNLESHYLVDGGFRRFPNFAIYGMKRSGKSSILRRLGRLFADHYPDNVCYIIVSCEGITGNFYERTHSVFIKCILNELNYKFNLASIDGWQEFCNKWEEPPEVIKDFRWIDSFYTALCRQWLSDKNLVIMIDEIERLYFELEEDDGYLSDEDEMRSPASVESSNIQSLLWDQINKLTQREGSNIRFVLCGSDFFTSKIIAEGDNLTQFFQKGAKLNVDRMEYGEIKEALQANTSIVLHDDAIEYLWNMANGLPWHSKIFCNTVIDQLITTTSGKRTTIYPADIQDAIDIILSTTKDIASPANFGLLSLNAEEQLIVRVAAEALGSRLDRISYDDLMDRICQIDKDETKSAKYETAIRSLVNERKLLKIDRSRNYQFACELYRMYLCREVPPRFKKIKEV